MIDLKGGSGHSTLEIKAHLKLWGNRTLEGRKKGYSEFLRCFAIEF